MGGDSRDVAARVVRWLADQPGWPLVLDNLDDVEVVKHSLPGTTNGGHTLITTRNPLALTLPEQGLEVPVLDDMAATKLLLTRAEIETQDENFNWSAKSRRNSDRYHSQSIKPLPIYANT